jgi:hypothetical protein
VYLSAQNLGELCACPLRIEALHTLARVYERRDRYGAVLLGARRRLVEQQLLDVCDQREACWLVFVVRVCWLSKGEIWISILFKACYSLECCRWKVR